MIEIKNGHVHIEGISPEIVVDICCLIEALDSADQLDIMETGIKIYTEHKQQAGKIEEAAEIIKKMDPDELMRKIKEAQNDSI